MIICSTEVSSFFSQPWLFVTTIDVNNIKDVKIMNKVLANENDSPLVQEKVNEFFKSVYSVRGL
jgi:hypothetical protein